MIVIQQDNFFNNFNHILKELKDIPIYNLNDWNKTFHPNDDHSKLCKWPGFRSGDLRYERPHLVQEFVFRLQENKYFKDLEYIDLLIYTHLRPYNKIDQDWIHTDKNVLLAGLVYLNDTNLNSGTYLFNKSDEIINDVKYVQNRLIVYDGRYRHVGYGHYGNNIDNGRLTLNFFIEKMTFKK